MTIFYDSMDASNLLSHFATFREFPGLQVPSSFLKENIEKLFPRLACCLTHTHDLIYINQAHLHVCMLSCFTVACQAPLSVGFSRQEYQSGLPCPPPRYLPNPGIEPRSPVLQAVSLLSEPPGKPMTQYWSYLIYSSNFI